MSRVCSLRTCHTMAELRQKMAEMHGKVPVQLTLYIQPMPERKP